MNAMPPTTTNNIIEIRSTAVAPWFAFYVTHESRCAAGLVEAGFEVFAPTYQRFVRRRAFKRLEATPLLPGYIFVRVPDGGFRDALAVEHVAYVLRADGTPRAVPECIIADVQALVASGRMDERLPAKKARPRRQCYRGLASLTAWFGLQKPEPEPDQLAT